VTIRPSPAKSAQDWGLLGVYWGPDSGVREESYRHAAMLSEPEFDLARLSARAAGDPAFGTLLTMVDAGLGVPIEILVGGQFITGSLESDVRWGRHLDQWRERLFAVAEIGIEDQSDEFRARQEELASAVHRISYEDAAHDALRAGTELTNAIREEIGERPDLNPLELPNGLARRWIARATRTHLTLVNATLTRTTVPESERALGTIRVAIRDIAAWRPRDAQGTNVNVD